MTGLGEVDSIPLDEPAGVPFDVLPVVPLPLPVDEERVRARPEVEGIGERECE